MNDADVAENWWGRIQNLHGEIITQWVQCRAARQPFEVEAAQLAASLSAHETEEQDLLRCEGLQRETTLARIREQLTWGLRKLDQFRTLSEADHQSIGSLSRQWLSGLQAHGMRLTESSIVEIRHATHAYLEQIESGYLDRTESRPVSEEYSTEVQLKVLHLSACNIQDPVLDIGCGKEAALVQWLRSQGMNAIGIDLLGNPSRGSVAADWFAFPFVPGYFGTIIAHLSFTLHFLRNHLDPNGDPERFAKQYMNILRALRAGGRFVYAPGLPFIEMLLPASSYRVTQFSIEDFPQHKHAAELFARRLGQDPLYTCHVERL